MSSHLIGTTTICIDEAAEEAARTSPSNYSTAYSEYAVGDWKTLTLWNEPNRDGDDVREHDYPAAPTPAGKALPAINELVRQLCSTELLRSVRIFSAENYAIIIPHRDYLEHPNGFFRIHLPLVTNSDARNSENEHVYHMRRGELWFLDGREIHSGGTLGTERRLHLVFDFESAHQVQSLIDLSALKLPDEPANIVPRRPFTTDQLDIIHRLGHVLTNANWGTALAFLARLHLEYEASAGDLYDWLDIIAQRSRNQELVQRSVAARRLFITHGPDDNQYGA
jgi:hypothetical protein